MSSTFMDSSRYLFTSESVTEGHPDKLCDQISDAILDAILARDPDARVACETCVTTGLVAVMGILPPLRKNACSPSASNLAGSC